MNYLITDTGFCQLLRPIGKNEGYSLYHDVNYNMLTVKSGKWNAKLHQVLDIIYNEGSTIIKVKDLKFRQDRLKYFIRSISEFQFVGQRYGRTIKGPIIGFDGETVVLHLRLEKRTSIPMSLYSLRYDSQFLYRHFFSQLWTGKTGIFDMQVLIRYLGLQWYHQ